MDTPTQIKNRQKVVIKKLQLEIEKVTREIKNANCGTCMKEDKARKRTLSQNLRVIRQLMRENANLKAQLEARTVVCGEPLTEPQKQGVLNRAWRKFRNLYKGRSNSIGKD